MLSFPQPHFMPCAECGASVARSDTDCHVCDADRRLDYVLLQLRDERAAFETQLAAYLDTPQGRFEAWYASRRR